MFCFLFCFFPCFSLVSLGRSVRYDGLDSTELLGARVAFAYTKSEQETVSSSAAQSSGGRRRALTTTWNTVVPRLDLVRLIRDEGRERAVLPLFVVQRRQAAGNIWRRQFSFFFLPRSSSFPSSRLLLPPPPRLGWARHYVLLLLLLPPPPISIESTVKCHKVGIKKGGLSVLLLIFLLSSSGSALSLKLMITTRWFQYAHFYDCLRHFRTLVFFLLPFFAYFSLKRSRTRRKRRPVVRPLASSARLARNGYILFRPERPITTGR